MKGKRFVLLLTAVLLGSMVAAATLRADAGDTARATQHPANKSGIMGRITFTDTGAGLVVTGMATGLAPLTFGRYVTLVYDVASAPGGPDLCEPAPDPIPGMFVGIWTSDAAGNGLLMQVAPPASIAPLGTFDTVSIRDTTINSGFGPQAVVACGQVAVNP